MSMFIHNQALALAEQGHKVGVLIPNYPHPRRVLNGTFSLREATSSYEIDGIPVINFLFLPIPYIHKLFTKLIVRRHYRRYVKSHGKPDILHAQFLWYGGIVANILSDIAKLPYIVTCHSSQFFREKTSKYKYHESKFVLRKAKAIIAVSKFLKERISNIYKLNDIKIISNTIDSDKFHLINPVISIKNDFTFTSIGSLLDNKGFKNLLIAFASIKNDRMRLNIIGRGPQKGELENLAMELNISNKIYFHGLLTSEKIIKVLESTNVVVSASKLETFGMTIIESLSCGIPVVATKSGGPEEIINKDNGILISSNSPQELSKAMEQIYNNYSFYDPKRIREECIRKYGKQNFAVMIEKIYTDILN